MKPNPCLREKQLILTVYLLCTKCALLRNLWEELEESDSGRLNAFDEHLDI